MNEIGEWIATVLEMLDNAAGLLQEIAKIRKENSAFLRAFALKKTLVE